ncbi:hypothetical protein FZ085_06485 [Listeria monocytogenes]|uniref:hypothetical protein n=1 Tax=Listeria farberi TaxID=2713500 RepID=UPI0011EAFFA4|nr:hypothetical protein [Listeria farberi]MBC2267068.1 hypothetical protein [Listeria farberi]MCD2229451.1 hypothetical protein [Listeria monocytogenes]TYW23262.1 hypothetical protein FZ085_06485 [Listeria monocytogenes]
MLFKSVFLKLERTQFNNEIIQKVNTESRALSVAYERMLKKEKIKGNFTRLVITGVKVSDTINQGINSSNILSLTIPFDEQSYVSFPTMKQRQEYLCALFEATFSMLKSKVEVNLKPFILETELPIHFSQKITEEYRCNNYQTTYLLKKGKLKKTNGTFEVWVNFTEKECSLKLRILNKKKLVEERIIFKANPYSVAFQFPFSDVLVTDTNIQVVGARSSLLTVLL